LERLSLNKKKTITLQYGNSRAEISIPDYADVLSANEPDCLTAPAKVIQKSMDEPIGTEPLEKLAQRCKTAAVVVSDNTRPVPYRGDNGILPPIINVLRNAGIINIKIIIATGTHRPMAEAEIRQMLGDCAFQDGIKIINHVCTDESMLRCIGRTNRTLEVMVNRHYLDAELKIVTGLVEPHFMAGFSGGRKAICPGICGQKVTYGFHSAEILNEKNSTTLILEGNPCHEESLQIAKMAGVDFAVNVTINANGKITGIFCGELEKSHLTAVNFLKHYATFKINKLYDVVIAQSGHVGVNHYQCAKVALEATRAVKRDGRLIILADITDPDPVGGENYKKVLGMMKRLGSKNFLDHILSKDWTFVPEQWQVQMWAKVFERLKTPENLYLCTPQQEKLKANLFLESNVSISRVQNIIDKVIQPDHSVLVMPNGPYSIPALE
jgi:lactate racemase